MRCAVGCAVAKCPRSIERSDEISLDRAAARAYLADSQANSNRRTGESDDATGPSHAPAARNLPDREGRGARGDPAERREGLTLSLSPGGGFPPANAGKKTRPSLAPSRGSRARSVSAQDGAPGRKRSPRSHSNPRRRDRGGDPASPILFDLPQASGRRSINASHSTSAVPLASPTAYRAIEPRSSRYIETPAKRPRVSIT